jgi:hypothetical protein
VSAPFLGINLPRGVKERGFESGAGDLYLRPPHVLVATAISGCDPEGSSVAAATWQQADWLNRLSVANKQDFARLHGFRFMLTAVQASTGSYGCPSANSIHCVTNIVCCEAQPQTSFLYA